MRVIIVGGGIGGMTAANALEQRGIGVEVYERATALAEVGAGVSLWPNALKALHQLGMKHRLDTMSSVSDIAAVRRSDGAMLSHTSSRDFVDRFGLPATVFHRAELLDALVERARRVPMHLGRALEKVEIHSERVTAHFAGGTQATGELLVGADGLRSIVRQQLGIPGEPRYAGYTAWRGIAPIAPAGLIAGETLGCGMRFGLVPITGNRVYWYATSNAPEGRREAPDAMKAQLLALFQAWHPPIPDLIAATDAALILHNDIYDRDPVDRWGTGPVTLLGDAAHPMTPNLGQGACQAIEDALVLARCIAGAPGTPALRRYEAERIPRTTSVVLGSRRVGRVGQVQSPIACRLRDAALRLLPRSVTFRQLAPVVGYQGHLG